MLESRAIYVPCHGLPETVRVVRFVNRSTDAPPNNSHSVRENHSDRATTIEIWPGNYYGDLDGQMVACRSATDRAEFVFAGSEAPRIEPERSLVVLLHNPPERWEVEFESGVAASTGRAGSFGVRIDNFGTARDTFGDQRAAGASLGPAALTHAR